VTAAIAVTASAAASAALPSSRDEELAIVWKVKAVSCAKRVVTCGHSTVEPRIDHTVVSGVLISTSAAGR
jgi:hypothetical protein